MANTTTITEETQAQTQEQEQAQAPEQDVAPAPAQEEEEEQTPVALERTFNPERASIKRQTENGETWYVIGYGDIELGSIVKDNRNYRGTMANPGGDFSITRENKNMGAVRDDMMEALQEHYRVLVGIDAAPNFCLCGCGEWVKPKRNFRQGHDARVKGVLSRMASGDTREGDRISDLLLERAKNDPNFQVAGYTSADILRLVKQEAEAQAEAAKVPVAAD